MRLSLKTKFTLMTSLLVLGAMALGAAFTIAQRTGQVIQDTNEKARQMAQQVFFQAKQARFNNRSVRNPLSWHWYAPPRWSHVLTLHA